MERKKSNSCMGHCLKWDIYICMKIFKNELKINCTKVQWNINLNCNFGALVSGQTPQVHVTNPMSHVEPNARTFQLTIFKQVRHLWSDLTRSTPSKIIVIDAVSAWYINLHLRGITRIRFTAVLRLLKISRCPDHNICTNMHSAVFG